jgi:hypothetical protein
LAIIHWMILRSPKSTARPKSLTKMKRPASDPAMRELVQTVTVHRDPSKPGGVEILITGRLNALLGENAFPSGIRSGDCW